MRPHSLYSDYSLDPQRIETMKERYISFFNQDPQALFLSPGRIEVLGNHTDHQKGKTLSAAIDLNTLALTGPLDKPVIRMISQGYPEEIVSLDDLSMDAGEKNSTRALIKGMLQAFAGRGYLLDHGLNLYIESQVPAGSGLSSSASFEMLLASILNDQFGNPFGPMELAMLCQQAENTYFGKPSGLLDPATIAHGGVVFLDFGQEKPRAQTIEDLDLLEDYVFCICKDQTSHADLSGEYASIVNELKDVSASFGLEYLSFLPKEQLVAALGELLQKGNDRALLRALHVLDENGRVLQAFDALEKKDLEALLELIRQSGLSSQRWLQNIYPASIPTSQKLSLALYLAELLAGKTGAVRVHGGGFGGSLLAVLPKDEVSSFKKGYESVFGKDSVLPVSLYSYGARRIW